jgi:hypothetical protein
MVEVLTARFWSYMHSRNFLEVDGAMEVKNVKKI